MRAPTLERDGWRLDSGEERSLATPDTFTIPPREVRENLRPGDLAQLIFEIACEEEDGSVELQGERMWVLVVEGDHHGYLGILSNRPISVSEDSEFYLIWGAEIPFWPEHVIDVTEPEPEFVAKVMGKAPTRLWPRNEIPA
jgi:hypothetical protein